jgi:hypothetical protein
MNGAKKVAGLLLLLVLTGAFLMLANKTSFWAATLTVTALHVLSALLLAIVIVRFLKKHVARERDKGIFGLGKLLQSLFLLLTYASGLALIAVGRRSWIPPVHVLLGFGFIAAVLVHTGAVRKQFVLGGLTEGAKIGGFLVFVGLVLSARMTIVNTGKSIPDELRTIPNAFMQLSERLPDYQQETMSPDGCARCHSEIVRQWKQSLHAVADSEIIYARVVSEFREKHGVEASNWCASCHSPLRVARGQLNLKVADVDQPNVDCMVCHSITAIHQPHGDNRFTLKLKPENGYAVGLGQRISDRFMLLQPAAHQLRWNSVVTNTPEFCGTCHSQSTPPFVAESGHSLVLQDTYGEWARSRFNSTDPATRKSCQDCHMPANENRWTSLGQKTPSHYFAGGSVDIARLSGARERLKLATDLLANTASLALDVQQCGSNNIELRAQVTNFGAGHNLPTGVTDLREVWLEVIVSGEMGEVIYSSGRVDGNGYLDERAIRFGVTLGDAEKKPIRFHDIARARYILSDTTIPSGATHQVSYSIPLLGQKKADVKVRLLYRGVPQDFINHYMTSDLRFQIVTMASASLSFDAGAGCGS